MANRATPAVTHTVQRFNLNALEGTVVEFVGGGTGGDEEMGGDGVATGTFSSVILNKVLKKLLFNYKIDSSRRKIKAKRYFINF